MMNAKRMGFRPGAYRNTTVRPYETFDPNFKFKPFKLYIITSEDDKWAITTDQEKEDVYLAPPDKANKFQWVLIDGDTGVICWFSDLQSYMNIELKQGVIAVKRSDVLKNGAFEFRIDNTIHFRKEGQFKQPGYQLAFRRPGVAAPAAAKAEEKPAEEPKPADAAGAPVEEKKEGFLARMYEAFVTGWGRYEYFDANKDPVLEGVAEDDIKKNPGVYSTTWKYVEAMDLRSLTDNADTIAELQKVGTSNNSQITALQKMLESEKEINQIEIQYRDDKIKGYEENRFIRMFLSPKA